MQENVQLEVLHRSIGFCHSVPCIILALSYCLEDMPPLQTPFREKERGSEAELRKKGRFKGNERAFAV